MKHIIALIFLCQTCFGQQVEESSSITPGDLGAYKWTLSGTAQENQVVIFRVTTIDSRNDELITRMSDSVHYSPGKKVTETAFFIDPRYFDPKRIDEPEWKYDVVGASGWIKGTHKSSLWGHDKGEISFVSKEWGETKIIFQVFIKSLEEASKLHRRLLKVTPNGGWSYNRTLETQREPVSSGQPATDSEPKSVTEDKPKPASEEHPK